MKYRARSLGLIGLAALAFVVTHLISARVRALPPEPSQSLAYGSVGIVDGQTVRVNVSILSPAPPTDPTAVEIRFLASDGAVIRETAVQLAPGQTAFFDFSSASASAGASGGRMQIRADVRVTIPPGPSETPASQLLSTLEVFENSTGKTSLLYPQAPIPVGESHRSDD